MSQVYRIDQKKEYKTLVIAALAFFLFIGLFTWFGYLARGLFGKADEINVSTFVIVFAVLYGAVLLILISNSKKDIRYWRLEILDEDSFILTNSRQRPVDYKIQEIAKIDAQNDRMLFILLKQRRKRVYVNSNLERFEEITAYFQSMAIRVKNLPKPAPES